MANAVTLPGERLAGLTADLFHKLQSGNLTLDEFALFNQRKNPFEIAVPTPVPDTFRLTVDYSQSLEQMIAAGHYDWTNDNITAKRFPIEGNDTAVEYEARYFHFKRDLSSENAIKEIEQAGWSPAKIEHVLSHGKTFPEEQRKYLIFALGSVAKVYGLCNVPFLFRSDSKRRLDLVWFGNDWRSGYRFLAVRKVSGA